MKENEQTTTQTAQDSKKESGTKGEGPGGPKTQTQQNSPGQSPQQQQQTQAPVNGKCVKKNELKEILDQQKWDSQLEQIESQCDQKLKDCLKNDNDALLALYTDVNDTVEKFTQEFEKITNQVECMVQNNESVLAKIPAGASAEINQIIVEVESKIENWETCQQKIECAVEGEGECNNANHKCLDSKPEIKVDCTAETVAKLKILLTAKDEQERSNRYNEIMTKEFEDFKKTQATIEDYLKKAGDYQAKAETAKQASKACQMYAYALMTQKLLDKTKEVLEENNVEGAENKFEVNLVAALQALRKAKQDKCYRDYVKDKTEAILAFVTQNIDDAKKNREVTILDRIVSTPQ